MRVKIWLQPNDELTSVKSLEGDFSGLLAVRSYGMAPYVDSNS